MKALTQDDIQKIFSADLKLKSTELIWDDATKGQIYKSTNHRKKIYWTIQTPEMICVSPAEDKDPLTHYFYMFGIIEEVSHRLRFCETMNIDPVKVKGLLIHNGNTFENAKKAVAYLDEWRLNEDYWEKDPELQKKRADQQTLKDRKKSSPSRF